LCTAANLNGIDFCRLVSGRRLKKWKWRLSTLGVRVMKKCRGLRQRLAVKLLDEAMSDLANSFPDIYARAA
jgi:hypothetical protein